MQSTEWRPVPEYEDIYEISTAGRIRRIVDSGVKAKAGDFITPVQIKNGRMVVRLSRAGKKQHRYLHRLVALAFLGDPSGDFEVCHNNGDPTDNRLANLRWDTHAANMRDMVRHGNHRNGNERKTHCPKGHPYDEENTRLSPDGRKRACKACHMVWQRERRARSRNV